MANERFRATLPLLRGGRFGLHARDLGLDELACRRHLAEDLLAEVVRLASLSFDLQSENARLKHGDQQNTPVGPWTE